MLTAQLPTENAQTDLNESQIYISINYSNTVNEINIGPTCYVWDITLIYNPTSKGVDKGVDKIIVYQLNKMSLLNVLLYLCVNKWRSEVDCTHHRSSPEIKRKEKKNKCNCHIWQISAKTVNWQFIAIWTMLRYTVIANSMDIKFNSIQLLQSRLNRTHT